MSTEANTEFVARGAVSSPLALLFSISALIFVVLACASFWMAGPIIHADEGGYLLNAAAMIGKLRTSAIFGDDYSGYSLFLIPAWWLFKDPMAIYHACLVTNAALIATLPFGLYWLLTGTTPLASEKAKMFAAAAGACYAPVLVMSQLAFSENALIPLYVWFLAFTVAAVEHRRIGSLALAAGVLAGALFLVHPRGAALVVPVMLVMTAFVVQRRGGMLAVTTIWACAAAVATLHWPLEWLAGKYSTGAGGHHNYSISNIAVGVFSGDPWGRIGADVFGVSSYVVIASAGLVVAAIFNGRPAIFRYWRLRPLETSDAVSISAVCALICAIFMTAIFLSHAHRVDQVIYGRYVEPAMVPLIAMGALGLMNGNRRALKIAGLCSLALVAIMGLLFHYMKLPPRSPWMPSNVIGLYAPLAFAGGVHWLYVGAYVLILFAVLIWAARHRPEPVIGIFLAINLVIAGAFFMSQLRPQTVTRDRGRGIVRAAQRVEARYGRRLCVEIGPKVDHWHLVDYRYWLYNDIPQSASSEVCIPARIGSISAYASIQDWHLVEAAPNGKIGLFIDTASKISPLKGEAQ